MKKYLVSNKLIPINNKLVIGGSMSKIKPKQNINVNHPKPNFGKPLKFLV